MRLRWLLNALEEQTIGASWEAIVVHDYDEATAQRVITEHPLALAGVLRERRIASGTGSPARQRNIGWRLARAELVAFTDDDCRPEPGWLAELLAVAARSEGSVVQGTTRPDPFEREVSAAPHVRTLRIDPVGPYCQTSNILYPRGLLERLDGFDEVAISGEDVGLSLRARAAGAAVVAAENAIVNHAIESHTLPGILGQNLKWRHLAYLVERHPEFRRELTLGLFWDRDHLYVAAAMFGLALSAIDRRSAILTLPYGWRALNRRGRSPSARATAAAELPGQAVRQGAEVIGMVAGSVRHRTALL